MPAVKKQTRKKPEAGKSATMLSIANRIGDMEFDPGIKMAIYGRSGTGKTTLWSTWPGPILSVICSGGHNPGELRSIDTPENRKKIKTINIERSGDIRDIVDYLRTSDFATVVLDHATSLQDIVLKEILELDEIPAQGSWGMAKQQDWGQCALQMKELLRSLLNLPINVIIVAQERDFNGDDNNELLMPFVGPAMTPSVTGWLNPAVDYICQTFLRQKEQIKKVKVGAKTVEKSVKIKGVEYCLRTGPDPVFTTKFRMPRGLELPDVVVDPTYDKIIGLINPV